MSVTSGPRGIVLVGVLLLLSVLLAGAAVLFSEAWVELRSASNGAAASETLYTAEAGLHHFWSHIEPAPDFTRTTAPGRQSPSVGRRPFTVGSSAEGTSLRVWSEARAHRGARGRVEALFRREERFRPPALLLVGAGLQSFRVSGTLRLASAGPTAPGIGVAADESGRRVREAVPDTVGLVGPSGLEAACDRLRATADRVTSGNVADGAWGSVADPEVVHLAGATDVSGSRVAHGIVLADDLLRIGGDLTIDGLLLAPKGLRVDGTATVRGALWVGTAIDVAGSLEIVRNDDALDRADTLRPGTLPRAPFLGGWRELW